MQRLVSECIRAKGRLYAAFVSVRHSGPFEEPYRFVSSWKTRIDSPLIPTESQEPNQAVFFWLLPSFSQRLLDIDKSFNWERSLLLDSRKPRCLNLRLGFENQERKQDMLCILYWTGT